MGCLAWLKYITLDVWEIRKHKLYDSDSVSDLQLLSQSSPGKRRIVFLSLIRMVS